MPDAEDRAHSDGPEPPQGGPGHTHEAGPGQKRGFSRRERIGAAVMLTLAVCLGAAALIAQLVQQHSFENDLAVRHAANVQVQNAQAVAEQAKLCKILLPLAALKPPAGPADGYPARAYDQQLAARLAGLAPAVGCTK